MISDEKLPGFIVGIGKHLFLPFGEYPEQTQLVLTSVLADGLSESCVRDIRSFRVKVAYAASSISAGNSTMGSSGLRACADVINPAKTSTRAKHGYKWRIGSPINLKSEGLYFGYARASKSSPRECGLNGLQVHFFKNHKARFAVCRTRD